MTARCAIFIQEKNRLPVLPRISLHSAEGLQRVDPAAASQTIELYAMQREKQAWAVTSMCSDDWLVVRMKKKPFDNDTEVRVDDIRLGDNCSATRVLSFNYEFSYPVASCEISKLTFQGNDVFILSEVRYRPVLDLTHKFQVVCFVKRPKLSSVDPFRINGYNVNSFGMALK
ncbi:oocyte-secreted protein 4B [Acomys russatus]|uniref:oocyte-secreted protein 4B n=1 Tax=Acomys russatus TaxID=60746 RepID=UPI0021E2B79D|nr:oocyte-secreted protein 4B [Acomys russatus]